MNYVLIAALTCMRWGFPRNRLPEQLLYVEMIYICGERESWTAGHFHPPVRRSPARTGRTPCRPQCNGHPLSARYWEAAAPGTNPNLLLRTESQHTSVDSNYSSA